MKDSTQYDGASDDPVHVEGFEPKHFLNAEPADDFAHSERKSKQKAEKEDADHDKSGSKEGRTKWDTENPPMKKPMTAIRPGHCMALSPLMA